MIYTVRIYNRINTESIDISTLSVFDRLQMQCLIKSGKLMTIDGNGNNNTILLAQLLKEVSSFSN